MSELGILLWLTIPLGFLPFIVGSGFYLRGIAAGSCWLAGLISIGLILMFGHAVHLPQALTLIMIGLSVVAAGTLSFRYASTSTQKWSRIIPSWKILPGILFIFILLFCAFIAILSHPLNPLHQDALTIWYYKAKGLFYWVPFQDLPFPEFAMKNYPHLGPALEVYVMKFFGTPEEAIGRLIFPCFYFVWIGSLAQLGKSVETGILHLAAAFLGLAFFQTSFYTNGYQDGFLAAVSGMACIHFCWVLMNSLKAEDQPVKLSRIHSFLAFFFTGSLCFIKTEGTVMALILPTAFFSVCLLTDYKAFLKTEVKYFAPFILMLIVMIVAWPLIVLAHKIDPTKISGPAFSVSGILGWYHHLDRWPVIASHMAVYTKANLLPIISTLIVAAWVSLSKSQFRKPLIFLLLVLFARCLFVPVVFFATQLPLEWHLATAFDRLMFQQFFIYLLIIYFGFVQLNQTIAQSKQNNPETPALGAAGSVYSS